VTLVDAAASAKPADPIQPVYPSPETEACRDAFGELLLQIAGVAAMSGNLERLHREYRRSSRRVRALQDVLLPEVDRQLYEIETQLDETGAGRGAGREVVDGSGSDRHLPEERRRSARARTCGGLQCNRRIAA